MPYSLSFFIYKLQIALCFGVDGRKWKGDFDDVESLEPIGNDWTRLLSDSILKNIFLYCVVFTTHPSSPFIQPHQSSAPLRLSQVCLRWRETALDTPELWSSIYIRNDLHHELLRLWLGRSGADAPLDLRMHIERTAQEAKAAMDLIHLHPTVRNLLENEGEKSRLDNAWGMLIPQMDRWRRVELVLDWQSSLKFLELPLDKATKLTHLSIQLASQDDELGEKILAFLLICVGSLKFGMERFSWDGPPSRGIIYHAIWKNLRDIHLSMGLTMDQSVRFLAQCVQAEEVVLGCITDAELGYEDKEHALLMDAFCRESQHHSQGKMDSDERSGAKRHELPKLRNLSIGLQGSACDCTIILQFFTLPSLRTLSLQNFHTTLKSCSLIEEFLLRSSKAAGRYWKFEKLSIVDHHMPEHVLHALLSISPPGLRCIPVVSYYTRRKVRLEFLQMALGICINPALTQGLEYYQDACGGTWVGRGDSSFTYLIF